MENIQGTQRGNLMSSPNDCPQRDERLGWTGDAQVFSMTAAYNFDVAAWYWVERLYLVPFYKPLSFLVLKKKKKKKKKKY